MPIQTIATLQGHPWDLWGLASIFKGSDVTQTLVTATKPTGRPTYDTTDVDAINRFRTMGYDVFATLTSAELLWDEGKGPVDLRDMTPIAQTLVERVNGIAMLLDPEYRPAKLIYTSYSAQNGGGSHVLGNWTPNRDQTPLGRHPEEVNFAIDILPLALSDRQIKFVLDAIALPRTWASLYLIYDAISAHVGGVHKLKEMGWITSNDLSDFANSANNSRNIYEGARHGNSPQAGRPLISLIDAYAIINRLALSWLDWLRATA